MQTGTSDQTVEQTIALASAAFGHPLTDAVDLGGSRRSQVVRCAVGGGGTVVVKRFLDGGDGFVREAVGLTTLDRTPDLLAEDAEHRLLVMSDVGRLPTLADLLLADDRDAAWSGARSWARALGELVGRSRVDVARERLDAALVHPWDAMADVRAGAARLYETVTLDGADREGIEAELAAAGYLLEPGDRAVVTPTDTCPDNAVLGPDGWLFLDLEGTDVQHAAFVGVYAALPFPTCWCVYDPPPGLTGELFAELTAGLAAHAPHLVVEPGWSRSVTQAGGLSVLLSTLWLLDGARAARPNVGPAGRSPSFRQLLASRWRWAALHLRTEMPALAGGFGAAARWAAAEWGADGEATGYPAFAD